MREALQCVIYLPRQLTVMLISSLSKIHFATYVEFLVVMEPYKSCKEPTRYLWLHTFPSGLTGMESPYLCGETICTDRI